MTRKITTDARRAPGRCDCSVARAPPSPPRAAMKNTPSASKTQKATNSQVPSTVGAHLIASRLPPPARREAHHGRGDSAELLGIGGLLLARGIAPRRLLCRPAPPDLLVEHREVLDLGEDLVGCRDRPDLVDEHVDRPARRRELLELPLDEHQRLGPHGQPMALVHL